MKQQNNTHTQKKVLEAEGEAAAIGLRAAAQAEAVKTMAAALQTTGGADAATFALAKEYVAMYGQIGSTSNTMLFQERPGDASSLLAQAAAVLQASGAAGLGKPAAALKAIAAPAGGNLLPARPASPTH